MNESAKISPAFEQLLQDSGRNEIKEAIVVLRSPLGSAEPQFNPRRSLEKRGKRVEQVRRSQGQIGRNLIRRYAVESGTALGRDFASRAESIPMTLPVLPIPVTQTTLPELARSNDVIAIMPNQSIRLIDPQRRNHTARTARGRKRSATWGLEKLLVPDLWRKTRGSDIYVAVLDTGVHSAHPALRGKVKDFVIIDPQGRRVSAKPHFDAEQHGTHVCGTVAGGITPDGVAIGVAPDSRLLVAGVLVGQASLETVVQGISWAVEMGADVINMSLGFSYYEPMFDVLLNALVKTYNILPVAAIGNENHGNTSSPGNVPSAFAVGAVEASGRGSLGVTSFSSGASLTFFQSSEASRVVVKPNLVAPGADVYSCIPPELTPSGLVEYAFMDGTSMAAPHVSGVAALLMSAHPDAPVETIATVMQQTATHPKGTQMRPDNRWGWGLVQPVEALRALG